MPRSSFLHDLRSSRLFVILLLKTGRRAITTAALPILAAVCSLLSETLLPERAFAQQIGSRPVSSFSCSRTVLQKRTG
jgi:hypothetical protein